MMYLFSEKNIRHFLVILNPVWIIILYIAAPYFFLNNHDQYSAQVIQLALMALIPWFIVPFLISKQGVNFTWKRFKETRPLTSKFEIITWLALISILVCLTLISGNLPIWTALTGASWEKILSDRLMFDLNKSGWISLVTYSGILITSTALPYFTTKSFILNHKYKWIKLLISSLILVSGLNKISFLKVALPILTLSFIKKDFKLLSKLSFFSLCFLFLISFIGRGGIGSLINQENQQLKTDAKIETGTKSVEEASSFIVYRAFQIPYMTASTWIDYYQKHNLEKNQPIITNRTLSLIFNQPLVPLEQDIINYQFSADKTRFNGYANTTYFIDAWVKFGKVGFFIVIILVPLFFSLQIYAIPKDYLGLLTFSILTLTSNSFISYLLSGGIILFIFSFYLKNKYSLKP